MKKRAIAFISVFLFAFPIATAYCCCTEIPKAKQIQQDSEHEKHCAGHGEKSSPSHNPDQCSHPQIIGDLVQQNFFTALSHAWKSIFDTKDIPTSLSDSAAELLTSRPKFINTGPPGSKSSLTPLYIQISVLRI